NRSDKARAMSRERNADYRERNREEIRERTKAWAEENKDHLKDYRRKYYLENREKILETNKIYRNAHREEIKESKDRWYKENAERSKLRAVKWAEANPMKVAAAKMRHRAKKKGAHANISDTYLSEVLEYFNGACALTGETENITFDHVIPLSVSDRGSVKGNIIPINHSINSSKNDRNIFLWFSEYGDSLGISGDKFNELISFLAKENYMTEKEFEDYYFSFFSPSQ